MPTVLLAGGSGLIGRRLHELLHLRGYTVRLLSRNPKGTDQFRWQPDQGVLDDAALQDLDYVINLAGEGIAEHRWTDERKREIIDSRVKSAHLLRDSFERLNIRPKAYLSASAIGYYGNSGERRMREIDPPVEDSFMVQCCQAWEQAADEVAALGIRTVKFRIGVVLAKEGGALLEFIKPLRFGLGTYFADGRAWYSWVHRNDLCRAFVWAMENEAMSGVYNMVAPQPERIKPLVQTAARAMGKRALIVAVPAFALHLALGEMSGVVLNSNLVSDDKIRAAGFVFEYPELSGALQDILGK
ncbi:MAG: TIGR01777 family oxidoreductase [Saprospiraceae bacterium]